MSDLQLRGDFNMIRGKLKQKWSSLTDDDLALAEGQVEELIGRIQRRTGEARDTIAKTLRDLANAVADGE